jgi:PhzF family phenazine biosynthesis protein
MGAGIPLFIVDAFTSKPFRGNPAAVCLLEKSLPDESLQLIAREMNLSETAFPLPRTGPAEYSLRWFTPTTEVPLCGHATLASAKVLFDEVKIKADVIRFQTMTGELLARRGKHGIALDFPKEEPVPTSAPAPVLRALGNPTVEDAVAGSRSTNLLLRLPGAREVEQLSPDFRSLERSTLAGKIHGVIVTAAGQSPHDFVSRYFAPGLGVDEDPVTGSSHTLLAPYWADRLGKSELFAFQASKRGGELRLKLDPPDRVTIEGQAQLISRGNLIAQTG